MIRPQHEAQLFEAEALTALGDFAAARASLSRLVVEYPTSARAWKALGIAENKLGDHATAERSLRRALDLDSTDADTWSSLGGVYVVQGRYAEAMASFEQATNRVSNTYALLNYLSMASLAGDYPAALAAHQSALVEGERACEAQISHAQNLPWCLYDLAQLEFMNGRLAEATALVRRAIGQSKAWQIKSARRTYHLLGRSEVFEAPVRSIIAEFDKAQSASSDTSSQGA